MFGWLTSSKSIRSEAHMLRAELREMQDALDRSWRRERDAIAMLEARDADLQKLRTELQRMTNVALTRSLRPSQEQPRDTLGRFTRPA